MSSTVVVGNKAARAAVVSLVGQWSKFVVQTVSLVVLARLLRPSEFGQLDMVMAVVGFAVILGDFGLSLAALQARELSRAQASTLFWINTTLGTVLCGILVVTSPLIAMFYGDPQLRELAMALAPLFFLNGLSAQYRIGLNRDLRFASLAINDVASQVAGLLVAIGLAVAGAGVWALVWQQLTVALVSALMLLLSSRWVPCWPSREANLGPLLRFGWQAAAVQGINYSTANFDSVMLGRVAGAGEVGIYNRAYQLFKIPVAQIAAPMTRVALPILSRIDDEATYLQYLVRAQTILCYMLFSAFAVAAAAGQHLLNVLLGPGWGGAGLLFRILTLGGCFQALGYVNYWVFLSKARTDLHLRWSLVGRPLMLALIAVGAFFGAVGVSIAVSTGLMGVWLLHTLVAVPKAGVPARPLIAAAVRPLAAGLLMFASGAWCAGFAAPSAGFTGVGLATLGSIVALVALTAFAPFRRDVANVLSALSSALRR